MALAARKSRKSGNVDRQPKINGDEDMLRVHKSIGIYALTTTARLNVTAIHFDYNDFIQHFPVQGYSGS